MTAAPNTFLIGAPKCGTTALAQYLSEHPGVFMGYPKEPSYWSRDLKRGESVIKLDKLEDYLSIYAQADGCSVVLDASTSYLYSEVAVSEILKFAPNGRFIIMLRNLLEMVNAYHMEKCFNFYEDEEDFEKAWRLQGARRAGASLPPMCVEPKELQYAQVAALGSQLKRALNLIPESQILVIFQEDLAADPAGTWKTVLDFLDLPDNGRQDFPVVAGAHFNRFPALARLYQNPPVWIAPAIRTVKKSARSGIGKSALAMLKKVLVQNKKRNALPEAFKAELLAALLPEIELLERLTARDLRHWKS